MPSFSARAILFWYEASRAFLPLAYFSFSKYPLFHTSYVLSVRFIIFNKIKNEYNLDIIEYDYDLDEDIIWKNVLEKMQYDYEAAQNALEEESGSSDISTSSLISMGESD